MYPPGPQQTSQRKSNPSLSLPCRFVPTSQLLERMSRFSERGLDLLIWDRFQPLPLCFEPEGSANTKKKSSQSSLQNVQSCIFGVITNPGAAFSS